MFLPFPLDPLTFIVGFVTASVFWWLMARIRPLWSDLTRNVKQQNEESQSRRTSNIEENHRRITLRRAQGMHMAAPLFALNEVVQEPRLLAPLPSVEPGGPIASEDIATQTLPYMPAWPDLGAIYGAPTLSIQRALSGGTNLVLIGQPGTGKTVALAHLATLSANRSESLGELSQAIPFLLHVADLKLPINNPRDVLNPIIDAASEHAPVLDLNRLPAFIQTTFRSGRALVLVDGFDELTPEGQEMISGYFELILSAFPKTRIVTTGAPEFVDGLIRLGFTPLSLVGWNRARTSRFIQNWGEMWTKLVAVEAWAQSGPEQIDPILLNHWVAADIQGLTPLEITLKVWAAYAGDSLGPHVLEAIASHIRRLAPSNTPLAALETLAMQVVLTTQPVFDPRKARGWVKSFDISDETEADIPDEEQGEAPEDTEKTGKEAKKKKVKITTPTATPGLLGKMASTGLVISHPNNKMRFVHPVIAGFLAGRALSGYNAIEALLNQPDWSGKYLSMQYLAAHGDVSKLSQKLLEWSRLPMHRPLLAASRWLRDAPRDAPWRGKVMASLATLLQTEGIPLALRGQALAGLVSSSDPSVGALFRQLMTTLSFDLVRLAALGAGAIRDVKSISVLQAVLDAPSISARRAACLALVSIGTTEALEIVAHTLLDGDEDVRRAAAESLANDPGEGHAMLKDGITLTNIPSRRAVVYGLARVDEPWAVEALQKLQVEDDQWVVRNSAGEILDSRNPVNDPRIPRPLKNPSELTWMIELAGKQGVGISPGAPVTNIALTALKSDDPDERLAVLPFLEVNPSEGVIKQLYTAMYGEDPELREAIYLALWKIGASGYKLPNPIQFGL